MDNYSPNYREWSSGHYEQWLPESRDEFNANNRLKRVERCAGHIKLGADRSMCRNFVYTEEEWRSGVRNAGKEPGEGWIMQPGAKLKRPAPQPEPVADTTKISPQTFADIYNESSDDLPF